MTLHLIQKIEHSAKLSAEDKEALSLAAMDGVRHLPARADIILEGDRPQALPLLLSGWACRYKNLEDGRRQITSFLLPGDLCDDPAFLLEPVDFSIGALTPVTVAHIPRRRVEELVAKHPRLAQAFWRDFLVGTAVQREWTVSLGQRNALERLAHLLGELFLRLGAVGLTEGTSCEMPLTQAELADAMGLSVVHVNRTLQELRATGLIVLRGRTLTIPDMAALQSAAQFTPGYLHLHEGGRQCDAND